MPQKSWNRIHFMDHFHDAPIYSFSLYYRQDRLFKLELYSPSGHIFCKQAAGDWIHCEWRSCKSHLHPLWGDTCPETEGAACFHGTRLYTTVGKYKKRFTSQLVRLIVRSTKKQMLPLPGGTFSKCCASRPRPRWWWSWWHTSCCTKCGNELHYGPERHWELGPCVSESSATGGKNSEGFHTARLALNSSNKTVKSYWHFS